MAHQSLVIAARESSRDLAGKTRGKRRVCTNAETESERSGGRIASLAPFEPADQYADACGRMHLLILIGASR